jgi:DNA-binding CsgD family transcriptional regulator
MVRLGLLQRNGAARGTIHPVDPRVGVRALIRDRQAGFDRLTAIAESMAADYSVGLLRAEPTRLLEVIEGKAAVACRIAELFASAEQEVCELDAPPYVVEPEDSSRGQARLLRRGVRFRSLYAAAALDSAERFTRIMSMVTLGEQVRVLAEVPLKLLLIDGHTALLPLTGREEAGERCRSIVVQASALTDALQTLFETLWRQAAPLRDPILADQALPLDTLTAMEKALVDMLAAGMKDEAIARQLGVSVRTLRRRISDLQGRLSAAGRFQAGVQAARRGWL